MKKILLVGITTLALAQTASAETYLECIKRVNAIDSNRSLYERYYEECNNGSSFSDPRATTCAAQVKDPSVCTKANLTDEDKKRFAECPRIYKVSAAECERQHLIACVRNIHTAVHRCYTDVYMQPLCEGNGNSCSASNPCATGFYCYDPEIGAMPTSPPSSGTQARCVDNTVMLSNACPYKAGTAGGLPTGGAQGAATAQAQPNREPDCGTCCSPNAGQPAMPAYRMPAMPVTQQQAVPARIDPAQYMIAPTPVPAPWTWPISEYMRRRAPDTPPALYANILDIAWDWLFGK